MTLSVYNLWGQVLRGPAEGFSIIVRSDVLLGETEVCKFSIAIFINKDVFGLQTTLDLIISHSYSRYMMKFW